MAVKKSSHVTRATITGEQDKEPAVWITQLQNNVNYGVRSHAKLSKRAVAQAIEHFRAVKFFVEVELPEITRANDKERLRRSAEIAKEEK